MQERMGALRSEAGAHCVHMSTHKQDVPTAHAPASTEGGRGTRQPPYTMPALLGSDTACVTTLYEAASTDGGRGAPAVAGTSVGGGRGAKRAPVKLALLFSGADPAHVNT